MADIIPFKNKFYPSDDESRTVWECTDCGSVEWIIAVDPVTIYCAGCGVMRAQETSA
jgi:ABC-type ATPase with predicted acetyltransferase domain